MDSYLLNTTSTSGLTSDEIAASMSTGSLIGLSIVILILAVLSIISSWKLFTKAGEKGWKSIIPIYNTVILFKISGTNPWFILAMALLAIIPFVGTLANFIICIFMYLNLAKSFGKGTGFSIGLILVPSIFLLILGFDKSEYIGPAGNNNTQQI